MIKETILLEINKTNSGKGVRAIEITTATGSVTNIQLKSEKVDWTTFQSVSWGYNTHIDQVVYCKTGKSYRSKKRSCIKRVIKIAKFIDKIDICKKEH